MVVFDEFSLGSLLRSDGEIDRERFPGFARLAAMSTWYPNATTVSPTTHVAVPSMLTGSRVADTDIPIGSVHPNNLFSLLRTTHDLRITEHVTRLCDFEACGPEAANGRSSLTNDAVAIYLHAVLPRSVSQRWLAPLGAKWTGFDLLANEPAKSRGEETVAASTEEFDRWRAADLEGRPHEQIRSFVSSIASDAPPTLWYLHVNLPHVPWRFLPTMQTYNGEHIPGLNAQSGRWIGEDYPSHALQRYLLQLAFTDRVLAGLLDRLDSTNVADDAVLVVTADHGVAFSQGGWRREVRDDNASQIIPVPLFIHLPGQQRAAIDPRNAEAVDILPTVAEALKIDTPWPTEGSSLNGERTQRFKHVITRSGRQRFPSRISGISSISTVISDLFGPVSKTDDFFGVGPHRDLLGKRTANVTVRDLAGGSHITLDEPRLYRDVEPAGFFVPALVRATITRDANFTAQWIGLALNGRIAGFGKPYQEFGETKLSAMVSPRYFVNGQNQLEFFILNDELLRIPQTAGEPFRVRSDRRGSVEAITSPSGTHLPVRSLGFAGHVDVVMSDEDSLSLRGWAIDTVGQQSPQAFVFVKHGSLLGWSTAIMSRPDVADVYRDVVFERSGFSANLGAVSLPDPKSLEVYAIFSNAAFRVPR